MKNQWSDRGFSFNAHNYLCDAEQVVMTFSERGLLMTLMCWEWIQDGDGIPNDPRVLAKMVGLTPGRMAKMWPKVTHFFKPHAEHPDRLIHPDLERERRRQRFPLGNKLREFLRRRDGDKCAYCGASGMFLEIEHMHPRALGGTDDAENLTLACGPCNRSKGTMTADEYRKALERVQ